MAEEVQIQGSEYVGKQRNPLGVIGLGIITLGIYLIFWYYYVNKEMAEIGQTRQTDLAGTSPGLSVVAVTLGGFILVPAIISPYMTWVRLQQASRMTGAEESFTPNIGYLLYCIPLVNLYALYAFQENMNRILDAQGGGGGALAAGADIPQSAPEQPAAPEQPQQ